MIPWKPELGKWVAVALLGLVICTFAGGLFGFVGGLLVGVGAMRFANIMTKEIHEVK